MSSLKIGILGKSSKREERRVPIHPEHLAKMQREIRRNLFFEKGYGNSFSVEDGIIDNFSGGTMEREALFRSCDVMLIHKPRPIDIMRMKRDSTLWGWAHFVQDAKITQSAIERKITAITFEGMHRWQNGGRGSDHIFHRNNEIAGYAGTLDALRIRGIDGYYGEEKKTVVIGFGSVSKGAVRALSGRGFKDITICTQRDPEKIYEKFEGVNYRRVEKNEDGKLTLCDGERKIPISRLLKGAEIIINGIKQDPLSPTMILEEEEIRKLKKNTLIIDISCDEGMGFPFSSPTTFSSPLKSIDQIFYYGVDHTPSYLWDAASREISNAIIPFISVLIEGRESWKNNITIERAIEIEEGRILNGKILSFQNRGNEFPHKIISNSSL